MKKTPAPQSLSWADLIWKAVADRPLLTTLVLMAALAIATFIYFDYFRVHVPISPRPDGVVAEESRTQFTILSLFIDVIIEDSDLSSSHNSRNMIVRSIYTIQLHRDFDEPSEIFQKSYT